MGSQQHVVGWRMKLEEEAFCCVCVCVCVCVRVRVSVVVDPADSESGVFVGIFCVLS